MTRYAVARMAHNGWHLPGPALQDRREKERQELRDLVGKNLLVRAFSLRH